MNRKQKLVLFAYSIVIVAMLVYPPFTLKLQGHIVLSEHSWLWKPIMLNGDYGKTALGTLNIAQLSFQLIAASLVAAALTIAQKDR